MDSLFEGDQWGMLDWQMSPQEILQQANKEKRLTILSSHYLEKKFELYGVFIK